MHGTSGRYAKWGCKCADCRAAHTLYESERRITARRKAKARGLRVSPLALDRPVRSGRRTLGPGQLLLLLPGLPPHHAAEARLIDLDLAA
ncbi:hypothetical protein [Amycolatopsis sp. NPDC004169]|uniref:hypothetical protein n=1 Tax=Amycolatopsis sp. NPDC004169 TaxID=3154453 RepID=UPI0033BF7098